MAVRYRPSWVTGPPAGKRAREMVMSSADKTGELERELARFLADYPDTTGFELLLPDINGILRGVRATREEMAGIIATGSYMSASTMLLDSRGLLPGALSAGVQDGDPDFPCRPVPGSFAPVPWARRPTGQCLVQMYAQGQSPYYYDSRHLLQRVLARFDELGLRPVLALELEFYLLADCDQPRPVPYALRVPGTGTAQHSPLLHGLEDLHELEGFLADVEAACRAQRIPLGNTMSEGGPGQYEINLKHVPDAELACDHAILLRRLVRGVARRHGLAATFMARPFTGLDGNGMHLHLSLLDREGRNLFAGRPPPGDPGAYAPALRHAIGGVLQALPESMAILAPNANSYRRLEPSSFLSVAPSWGYNHRRVGVRIPPSDDANVRFEYRPAGADANPYLVSAALLAAVHYGITRRVEPPPMAAGEGQVLEEFQGPAPYWEGALERFAGAEILREYLGQAFCDLYVQCRRLEAEEYRAQVPETDYLWYLGSI